MYCPGGKDAYDERDVDVGDGASVTESVDVDVITVEGVTVATMVAVGADVKAVTPGIALGVEDIVGVDTNWVVEQAEAKQIIRAKRKGENMFLCIAIYPN